MATKQHRPLLQVGIGRFMLQDCLWKCRWNITSRCWTAKLGTLHMGKNLPAYNFTFVRSAEVDRATSHSFASRNGSIHVARLSLEAQRERDFMLLEGEVGHFAHGKKYLFATSTFVRSAKGNRATSPCFANRNGLIHASRLSLEAQMERDFMLLEGEVRHFAHGKNICLHFLPLFMA